MSEKKYLDLCRVCGKIFLTDVFNGICPKCEKEHTPVKYGYKTVKRKERDKNERKK
jgi:Zn finger protein HypA/HybF involved in hydrogenase expression